jgi:hypothetical protein
LDGIYCHAHQNIWTSLGKIFNCRLIVSQKELWLVP